MPYHDHYTVQKREWSFSAYDDSHPMVELRDLRGVLIQLSAMNSLSFGVGTSTTRSNSGFEIQHGNDSPLSRTNCQPVTNLQPWIQQIVISFVFCSCETFVVSLV